MKIAVSVPDDVFEEAEQLRSRREAARTRPRAPDQGSGVRS
jgi:hypothetical protein